MKVSLLALAVTFLLALPAQEKDKDKKKVFDPFADPREEMIHNAENSAREKRYNELKAAAGELAELTGNLNEQIVAGGKDAIPARIFQNLDRAEKLIKTMREKAK